jgi:predicted small integral membrane protein
LSGDTILTVNAVEVEGIVCGWVGMEGENNHIALALALAVAIALALSKTDE